MDSDKIIREQLLSLLKGGNAHIRLEDVAKGFPKSFMNANVPNVPYTCWHLIEHMRIAQHDILDFIENPNYEEMDWPDDYWPPKGKTATSKEWQKSIDMFNNDSRKLQAIIKNPKTNLYAKIPHGTGQNIARETMLVADHNAYHLGELVLMKRAIGKWPKK